MGAGLTAVSPPRKNMFKQAYRLWLIFILAALVTACGQTDTTPEFTAAGFPKNNAGYADITVHQLAEMLPDKSFTLVNVHIPYEGELAQTDLFIPYNEMAANLAQLPDKEAPIVLYCRSGRMSAIAAKELARRGYNNVMELNGGFIAWEAAGYEMQK
jgi:rhodanese-related sulfurtransferase